MAHCDRVRCGIVLAAGEGKRLQSFVRRLRGDYLPKQYVSFIGSRSMLEHTFSRVERLIPPERLFTVVSRYHLGHAEVLRQLSGRPKGTVVVQPENRETAPGLLLPLMHLHKRYPRATVAVFPSDHFIAEEALLMAYVDLAMRVVERYPRYTVLLGIAPDEPETDYGYILPGSRVNNLAPLPVRKVLRFVEKPELRAAEKLVRTGSLWNTMIMAFNVTAFLERIRNVAPLLYGVFKRIEGVIGSSREAGVVNEAYRSLHPVNFSRGLLEGFPSEKEGGLLVLPVRGVSWSDWGSEERILKALKKAAALGHLKDTGAVHAFEKKLANTSINVA